MLLQCYYNVITLQNVELLEKEYVCVDGILASRIEVVLIIRPSG